MENLVVLFGIGVGIGIAIYVIWRFILWGHQEGNRQDYIIKIATLKEDNRILVKKLAHTNELLTDANNECHRLQGEIIRLNHQEETLKIYPYQAS